MGTRNNLRVFYKALEHNPFPRPRLRAGQTRASRGQVSLGEEKGISETTNFSAGFASCC